MHPKYALAILLICAPAANADLIPVTLEPDGLDTNLDSLMAPDGGPAWTTEANDVLVDNLLDLVTTLGGDSAEIAELFQPGAIFADDLEPTVPLVSSAELTLSSDTPADVPEPATMDLLAGGLLFLCLCAINSHGPLLRPD